MEYILKNNPNLHLKKFLGKTGEVLTKVYPSRSGKVSVAGVELLAYSADENEIIESGEKVKVIGINGRKLLVVSQSENKGKLNQKIKEIESKLYLEELFDKLDDYLYSSDEEGLAKLLNSIELSFSGRKKLISDLSALAEQLERDGELKEALELYKRISRLKKWE